VKIRNLHLILLFASFVLFIASMQIMRFYANNVMEYNNETILDLRFGYSQDDIKNYMNGLNDTGKNYYIKTFHLIDIFYPLVYGMFYIISLSYFIKNIFNKFAKLFLVIPVFGIVCDYCENVLINLFLKNINNVTENVSILSSCFTKAKFISIYSSLFLVIILMICFIIKRKNKNGQTST
jgi:hypothetical protein